MAPPTNLVRASRDGDQFHYLWAARRCLSLLHPNNELVAICIEGVSTNETRRGGKSSNGDSVIDVAEYFGSEKFEEAQIIRYVQLKHSTHQVDALWTASGLKKTLAGFAKKYRDLLLISTPDVLAQKLEFVFVSNRQISLSVLETIEDAVDQSASRHPNELKKLERATELSGHELSNFCKLLHFEDTEAGYGDQRNILAQDLSGYLPDGDWDAPTQVKELVNRKALSESANDPAIRKPDVLRVLKTDESKLYPCPCRVSLSFQAIHRSQNERLIREILSAGNRPVLIHAAGGVGKTVFATQIGAALPNGSIAIHYDCFGNAEYRNLSSLRHEHHRALVQIANELAAKTLCHPLIPSVHAGAADYLKAFTYRLKQAVTLIRSSTPDAVLCLVLDAVDNAQLACLEMGQARSFAYDLIREEIPEGVRLVALCRTHRQQLLDPPLSTLRLELEPFCETESSAHLRSKFPDATDQDAREFHRLSSANPRVQSFALMKNESLHKVLRSLGPNPTTPESSLDHLLEETVAAHLHSQPSAERGAIEKVCKGLAILRPLIPLSILSDISGIHISGIKSFVLDLGRPLILTGDSIQFSDEPSETWFREKFKPHHEELKKFILQLKPIATRSAYIASILPQLLLEAGELSELVELALKSEVLPDTNPLERRDIELQRLQFAVKACLKSQRYAEAAQLALKGAGESAGASRRRELLQSHTDLASTFLDLNTIQDVASRGVLGSKWRGSHHAYESGMLSGREELIPDARSRLRMAYDWLDNWSHLPSEERAQEEVSKEDIVELAFAQLNIHGAQAAERFLSSWRPKQISFDAGRLLVKRLLDHSRIQDVHDLAKCAWKNLCVLLAVILELRNEGISTPHEILDRAFQVSSRPNLRLRYEGGWESGVVVLEAVTALAECAVRAGVCSNEQASILLTKHIPSETQGISSRFSKIREPLLRALSFRAVLDSTQLELKDLAPQRIREELEKPAGSFRNQECREFERSVGALLPWYGLLAESNAGLVSKDQISDRLNRAETEHKKVLAHFYDERPEEADEITRIWWEILYRTNCADESAISDFRARIEDLRHPVNAGTLLSLARLSRSSDAIRGLTIEFSTRAYTALKDERVDAEILISDFIQIARTVLPVSSSEAKGYYDLALNMATNVGDENLPRWDAILDLAIRASKVDRPVPEVAYRFSRCAEVTYDLVVRDKYFPWSETVKALTSLCPSSSFAILSRWRDRGFGRFRSLIQVATESLLEAGRISALDALPLIAFDGIWDSPALLKSHLVQHTDPSTQAKGSSLLLRYLKLSAHPQSHWVNIKNVLQEHHLSFPEIEELASQESERKHQKELQEKKAFVSAENESQKPTMNWDQIFEGIDLATPDGMMDAHSKYSKANQDFRIHDNRFFGEALQRVPIGQELAAISAIKGSPWFGQYNLRNLLEQLPSEWPSRPAIRNELLQLSKEYCRRYCLSIERNRYYEVFPFRMVAELTQVDESIFTNEALRSIGESVEYLDSGRLHSLIGLLCPYLTPDEALEGLTFGLKLIETNANPEDADGPWSQELAPPSELNASLAGFLFAGLASPFASTRWEAAHSVVGFFSLGRTDVLRHLFDFVESKAIRAFADGQFIFYHIHAIQWLLVATARAATEFPETVKLFDSQLIKLATDDSPHILIRAFAASAVRSLIKNGQLNLDDQASALLSAVNVSPFPKAPLRPKSLARPEMSRALQTEGIDEFYFGIDYGPYWFQPLARVFGLTQREVEASALEIIRNELHHAGNGGRDDDQREARKVYTHESTYATHGSYPKADDLRFYLSYHAMMITAGRLLSTIPVQKRDDDEPIDAFTDWLSSHSLARSDDRWLADRRDPSPETCQTWKGLTNLGDRATEVTQSEFDEVLLSGSSINIWGSWKSIRSDSIRRVHIRSALSSPAHSSALIAALTTGREENRYWCLDSMLDDGVDQYGFVLKNWVDHQHGTSGLDDLDPWSGQVRFPPPRLSGEIAELLGVTSDQDLRIWRDAFGGRVVESQIWGQRKERDADTEEEYGEKLFATSKFLSEVLEKTRLDLVIQVDIETTSRYARYRPSNDDERSQISSKCYLYSAGSNHSSK